MLKAFGRFLKWRGVHYLVTRCAPNRVKGWAFDEKFRGGDWNFAKDGPDELAATIKYYARGGDILLMGCGSASIVADLGRDQFASVLGIDLSGEAIRLAHRYAAPNISFRQAEMVGFECEKDYDLIVFSESFNYVPFYQREALLLRLCDSLKLEGSILITIAQSKRYRRILTLIRRKFSVLEDRNFQGSERRLIVFRAIASH